MALAWPEARARIPEAKKVTTFERKGGCWHAAAGEGVNKGKNELVNSSLRLTHESEPWLRSNPPQNRGGRPLRIVNNE
jgi:hypothetical protein